MESYRIDVLYYDEFKQESVRESCFVEAHNMGDAVNKVVSYLGDEVIESIKVSSCDIGIMFMSPELADEVEQYNIR